MKKPLLFIMSLCCGSVGKAQVSWQSVPVPNESVLAAATNSTSAICIGTGTYGVFRSADDGVNWTDISAGLPDSIAQIQFSSDDKLFVATASHGIYQYAGGAWAGINTGLPVANINAVSFAKGVAGNMYMMASTGKIYSWNGGTWTDITNNFPASGRALAATSGGTLYAAAFASGVYKWDGISTWSVVGGAMPNNFITKMTVSVLDTLYVACNSNNVFKCATTGGTWTAINAGLPVANMNFIAGDAANRLYISPNTANGAVYRSLNGGVSWSAISTTLFTTAFNCFASSPSGKIYAGASGIFRSADGGDNWTDINTNLHAPRAVTCFSSTKTGVLYVGSRFGPWRSTDNGATWQLKNSGIAHLTSLQIMETAAGSLLYHAVNNTPKGAIYRSVDGGDNWNLVAANGADQYTKLKQHKSDTIWATSRFSGATSLSYSINNGATWVNNPLSISAVWDIDFSKENTIFLGTESEGVVRSDNGGQTFNLGVGNSIPWYGNVIEVETDASGVIFAGGDWWTHVLWFSQPTENGNVWTEFTDPDLVINGVQDLIFDQHNNAYIAVENGGVRMAYHAVWSAGTDWINSSTGLPSSANILELGFDTAGYIYSVCYTANGHNAGLFRSTVAVNPPASATYTFTGSGNWNLASNWANNRMPPASLSGNAVIIIDPLPSGECVLNVPQTVGNGTTVRLNQNKKLRLMASLDVSQ